MSWKTDSKVLISDLQSRPSGKSGVKAEYYSRVDHLMKEEPKASSQARYEDRSRRVDRRFLNDLSRWLDRLNSN